MKIEKEVFARKEVCDAIKTQIENELHKNDTFNIVGVFHNTEYDFMFAVVETADKRAIEVPLFYFWHNNIRVDTNLESTFKVVDFEFKNNLNYPKIIIL